MAKNGKTKNRRFKPSTPGATTSKTKYKAPTSGLEEVVFTWGTARDAAKYEEVKSKLSHHVGVQNWKFATETSKAMAGLEEPVFTKPVRPVREYWTDITRTVTTLDRTRTEIVPGEEGPPIVAESTRVINNIPTQEEWELQIATADYLEDNKAYKERKTAWEENRSKAFYLVLQHCPSELKNELKNAVCWEVIAADRCVVALLLAVRDVTHDKKERRHRTMAYVEDDFKMYTTTQRSDETLDDYYKAFKAQGDIINAHGGRAGFHQALFQEHLAKLIVEKVMTMAT